MRNVRRLAALLLLTLSPAAWTRAEVVSQAVGELELRGLHTPDEGPRRVVPLHFPRAGWIRGLTVHLVDASGKSADERGVFCHAAIRVPGPADAQFVGGTIGEPLHITLSEGANSMSFPEGYGLFVDSTTDAELEVKLQNEDLANEGAYRFQVSYEFSPLGQAPALKSLAGFVVLVGPPSPRKGAPPPLSWRLPKGKSRYTSKFTMPYTGTIHSLLFHIHQYARTLTVLDEATGKTLFTTTVKNRADGWPAATPVYSSVEGIPVAGGHHLLFRLDSDNTGPEPVSVMSLMRVYVHRAE